MTTLGNTTKSASGVHAQRRTERYILQAAARKLLPDERVAICMRYRAPYADRVEIRKDLHSARAFFGGVISCGSIWACPVCANRITEARREALQDALSGAGVDYYPILITYTIRHNAGHRLQTTLDTLKAANRKLRSGRWWQALKEKYFILGSVIALECTHGSNGWHPHQHEIMFLDMMQLANPHDPEQARRAMQDTIAMLDLALSKRWADITAQMGFATTLANGVTVQHTDAAVTNYVAKWGHLPDSENQGWTAAHEVTKAATKKSRKGGRSPFQLLADYAYNGDTKAGALFVEFVRVFKGKRQLLYTKQMKTRLMIDDQSDEEIAMDHDTPYDLLASLDIDQWRVVLANDARAEVLNVAAEGDADALRRYLDALPGMDDTRPFYD